MSAKNDKNPSEGIRAIIARAAYKKQQEFLPSTQDYEDVTALMIEYFWENSGFYQRKENILTELKKIEPKNKVFNRVGSDGRDEILSVLVEKKILTKAVVDNYYIDDYGRSSWISLTRKPGFTNHRTLIKPYNSSTKPEVELYRYATEHGTNL